MIPVCEIANSGMGRELKKSIPTIREREGNEKNPFPQFGNGKGMKKTHSHNSGTGREWKKTHSRNSGMGRKWKNPFPYFGKGNQRLSFLGMDGNGNSRSPLIPDGRERNGWCALIVAPVNHLPVNTTLLHSWSRWEARKSLVWLQACPYLPFCPSSTSAPNLPRGSRACKCSDDGESMARQKQEPSLWWGNMAVSYQHPLQWWWPSCATASTDWTAHAGWSPPWSPPGRHPTSLRQESIGLFYNRKPKTQSKFRLWFDLFTLFRHYQYPSWLSFNKYIIMLWFRKVFYQTRVRSLAALVTHWLTNWLTLSKLDWCDPGVRRCQLKTCWCC